MFQKFLRISQSEETTKPTGWNPKTKNSKPSPLFASRTQILPYWREKRLLGSKLGYLGFHETSREMFFRTDSFWPRKPTDNTRMRSTGDLDSAVRTKPGSGCESWRRSLKICRIWSFNHSWIWCLFWSWNSCRFFCHNCSLRWNRGSLGRQRRPGSLLKSAGWLGRNSGSWSLEFFNLRIGFFAAPKTKKEEPQNGHQGSQSGIHGTNLLSL